MFCIFSMCSDTDENLSCDSNDAITLSFNNCLLIEHNNLSSNDQALIESKIAEGITLINNLMDVDNIQIRVVRDLNLVIPEIGIGGFNPGENEIIIAINENFGNLNQSLNQELIPLLAHEAHHAKRRRSVGYGSTLFQAIITEGLADHFSMEVAGIDPPIWSVAVTGEELDNWLEMIANSWNTSPYDHGKWFLGTSTDTPRWLGYSMGYELVKRYLEENTDQRASSLHNKPASAFEP